MPLTGAGRLDVPALVLLVLLGLAACRPDDDTRPAARGAALPAYDAPAGTPDFCARLAGIGGLSRLPVSIGTLVSRVDVEARTQVSQVLRELRGVLSDVRDDGGAEELEAALDELVQTLGAAVDGPTTPPVGDAVSAALQEVGAQAQPSCGFPT